MENKDYRKQVRKHNIMCSIIIVISLIVLIATIIYIKKNFFVEISNPVENTFIITGMPKTPVMAPRILY